jgi:hypothetical protein
MKTRRASALTALLAGSSLIAPASALATARRRDPWSAPAR